jgi:hypothetical protein
VIKLDLGIPVKKVIVNASLKGLWYELTNALAEASVYLNSRGRN